MWRAGEVRRGSLWQVHLGEGNDEYREPGEFVRHTLLSESLKGLFVSALHRLRGDQWRPRRGRFSPDPERE